MRSPADACAAAARLITQAHIQAAADLEQHPVSVTIRFSNETVKELMARLRLAIRRLNRPLIQQLSALLLLHDGLNVWSIGARVGVSTTTVYAWRDGFLVKRWASLLRGTSSGRPPKLNPGQLKRLKELVIAGPEAAGYATGCWNAGLVQALSAREFGKSFHVSTLLKNLGFSYQKAHFVSDHLNEVARKRWRKRQWPAILRSARRQDASLLFADEASFAQLGSFLALLPFLLRLQRVEPCTFQG